MHENKFTFKPLEQAAPKQEPSIMELKSSLGLDIPVMIPPSVRSQALLQKAAHPALIKEEMDDDNATVSTRTEDDPVHLAMHAELQTKPLLVSSVSTASVWYFLASAQRLPRMSS